MFPQNSYFTNDNEEWKSVAEGLKPTPPNPQSDATMDSKKQHEEWADRLQRIIEDIEDEVSKLHIIDQLIDLHEDMTRDG